MNNIRSELTNLYVKLTKDCSINQLGPPYVYYHANEMKTNILGYDCLDIDIKSAFPTICSILFGKDHQFVKNIYSLDDKLKRNIYISNTLTDQTKRDGYPYILELNLWSKMLVLCYTYSNYENITILEYVKDGLIIKGTKKNIKKNYDFKLEEFIEQYNITFHEDNVDAYIRFNRTSIYRKQDNIKVKGQYHHPPQYIMYVLLMLFKNNIYNHSVLKEIKEIYKDLFFQILIQAKLNEEIQQYFSFNKNRYISDGGKLTENLMECKPKQYLVEFIYPIISLLRAQSKF